MADSAMNPDTLPFAQPRSVDEMRANARARFRDRILHGEKVGDCGCDDSEPADLNAPREHVAGVRFRDSGRVYFFSTDDPEIQIDDWVVVPTSRGQEAGRVVIAPRQMSLSQLEGDLHPIERRLNDEDIDRIEALKTESARALRRIGAYTRSKRLPVKPIAAEYSLDGQSLTFSYSTGDRVDASAMARALSELLGCAVVIKEVGPRDEARLLGGLGRCGRTLCCASWLPMFPDVSMGMAKNQELSLNPTKVSGVCGRLLCCLSYENDQYREAKAILPRLGQTIETADGPAQVVSLQILRQLVTIRVFETGEERTVSADELSGKKPEPAVVAPPVQLPADSIGAAVEAEVDHETDVEPEQAAPRRRRRRGRGRRNGNGAAE